MRLLSESRRMNCPEYVVSKIGMITANWRTYWIAWTRRRLRRQSPRPPDNEVQSHTTDRA